MSLQWTNQRIEKLKKLWSEGYSASQTAAQLGGVSRNAVIGKVRRLNLPGRSKQAGTIAVSKAPKPPAAPKHPSTTPAVGRSSFGSTLLQGVMPVVGRSTRPKTPKAPPKPAKAREKPLFNCRAVVLADIQDDECEYCLKSVDDGYSSDRTLYCGNARQPGRNLFCTGHVERIAKEAKRPAEGERKGGLLIGHYSDNREHLARYVPQS